MAKIMSNTDRTGTPHANSYWRISEIHINVSTGEATFIFVGFHNKAARLAGKPPYVQKEPYYVSGPEFADYYTKHIAGQMNLMQIGYEIAMKRLEATGNMIAPSTPEAPTSNKEANPVPEQKSFFDAATDDNT